MKPARLVILAIALGAAGLAGVMVMRSTNRLPAQIVERVAPVASVDVLVASGDLPVGQRLRAGDVSWRAWPSSLVPPAAITRSDDPGAADEMTSSIVRSSILSGEPIRREKLVKANGSGFMSAILPSGMRAIAISIDTRGATSAGGFILPNDRVDLLKTYRDDEASKSGGSDVQLSETILRNIRVLAIGQAVQERNGERVVTGETATLEVSPDQAETIALAQRTGQLALILRSLADAGQTETMREDRGEPGLTVVRYGVARQAAGR